MVRARGEVQVMECQINPNATVPFLDICMRVLCSRGNTSLSSSPVPSHHTDDVQVRAVLVDGYLKLPCPERKR